MKNDKRDRAAAIITGAILLCVGIGAIGAAHSNSTQNAANAPSTTATTQSETPPAAETQDSASSTPAASTTPNTGTADTNLSNSNTYTNVDGNTVHSPAASTDGSIPNGATAQCSDGSYSFSQHRSGTCSHHGGVATWL